jgi:hypothetical protein
VESRAIRVEAKRDDAERLVLIMPGRETPIVPTHWRFGQLCSLVGAPSSSLRDLPAPLAGVNLQHGLLSHRAELVKTLEAEDGRVELRAVTGPYYGRIWDHELIAAVMKIAVNGAGDTRWKVPGVLDWATMTHNPFVDVTKDTTTLYASDRDVFLFLVDDTHPIEAGRLPNGDPDLYFRGFYCWNSEVGSKALGIASFYLRAVCMNRNLWGVEGFEEISSVSIIDVIATTLFAATASVRLLVLKARIRIIVAKAERSSHSHSVDHMPSPPDRAVITTTPDDPIIDVRRSPNARLTCCKRAVAIKWVGREAAIVAEDIGKKVLSQIFIVGSAWVMLAGSRAGGIAR